MTAPTLERRQHENAHQHESTREARCPAQPVNPVGEEEPDPTGEHRLSQASPRVRTAAIGVEDPQAGVDEQVVNAACLGSVMRGADAMFQRHHGSMPGDRVASAVENGLLSSLHVDLDQRRLEVLWDHVIQTGHLHGDPLGIVADRSAPSVGILARRDRL